MFDLGWLELLIIGITALIVVGPEDLPKMFRTLGQWTGRIRALARDFQRSMNEAADQSGMRDVSRDLNTIGKFKNPGRAIREAADEMVGPLKDIEKDSDPGSETAKLAEKRRGEQAAARARADELAAARAAKAAEKAPPPPTPVTPEDDDPPRVAEGGRE